MKDALDVDNHAFTVVGTTRKAQVLAVTGRQPLPDRHAQDARRRRARRRHDRDARKRPRTTAVVRDVKGGRYDLVIYDGVKPEAPRRGQRALFRRLSAGPGVCQGQGGPQPVILDWDIAHPLMQYVRDLSLVYRRQGQHRRAARRRQEPDRRQPGPAGVRRPARGLHRHRRHLSASWTGRRPTRPGFDTSASRCSS